MPEGRGIALVTGANRGIGYEVARHMAQAGYEVILTARDTAKGEAAAARLAKEGVNVIARELDVSDPASILAARDWLQAQLPWLFPS